MKYFIATPTCEEKAYAQDEWIYSVKSQTHPDYVIAISDNSATSKYSTDLGKLITADIVAKPELATLELDPKLVAAHEDLRQRFLASDCDVFLSWESDVIAEPDALIKLEPYLTNADIVMCAYPDKENPKQNIVAMGFTAFKRAIIEKFAFDYLGGYGEQEGTFFGSDGWILYRARNDGAKIIQLTNIISLEHM